MAINAGLYVDDKNTNLIVHVITSTMRSRSGRTTNTHGSHTPTQTHIKKYIQTYTQIHKPTQTHIDAHTNEHTDIRPSAYQETHALASAGATSRPRRRYWCSQIDSIPSCLGNFLSLCLLSSIRFLVARSTDPPSDGLVGGQTDERTDGWTDGQTDGRIPTDRPFDRPTVRPTDRPTDRPIDRPTYLPTDRPT